MPACGCFLRLLAVLALMAAGSRVGGQPGPRTDLYGDPLPDGAVGRLGTTRLRPHRPIREIAFLPDGKTLASLDDEFGGAVLVSDFESGKERMYFRIGPGDRVAGTFSPDRKWLASTDGNDVRIHELATGKLLHGPDPRIKHANAGGEVAICFSGDGRIVATTSLDSLQVHLWDAGNGKKLRTLDMKNTPRAGTFLAGSPDGRLLAAANDSHNFGVIVVWELATGKRLYEFPGTASEGNLVFSPDGKLLAHSGEYRYKVVVREAGTGKRLHTTESEKSVWHLSFAPDGRTLAIGEESGAIRLIDTRTFEEQRKLQAPRDTRGIAYLTFSRDGRRVASAATSDVHGKADLAVVQVRELPSGNELLHATVPDMYQRWRCAFSADGATLAVAAEQAVRLWDVASGKERSPSVGHRNNISGLAVSADGRQIATAGDDGWTRVWNPATHTERGQWQEDLTLLPPQLAFAADGKTLSTLDFPGFQVRVWDVTGPGRLVRQTKPSEGPACFALSADGRSVAHGVRDGAVALMDVMTGKERARLEASPQEPARAWAFAPDGRRLAGTIGSSIVQWDLVRGKLLPYRIDGGPLGQLFLFSPDGRLLVNFRYEPDEPEGSRETILVLESVSGQRCLRIEASALAGTRIALAPNSRRLALGSRDGSVHLLDMATGELLGTLKGHRGAVCALQFSPDGAALYSASADTTVMIWDMARLPPKNLPPGDLDAAWMDLASTDAAKAYRAIWALTAAPKQSVPLLCGRLKPIAPFDEKPLRRWIADLDGDDFETREAAFKELTRLGDLIEPTVCETLKGQVPLETRRRLERLLKAMPYPVPAPTELQQMRAVQVLELIGTLEPRTLLQALAKGAAGAQQTREAEESLERLAKRVDQ